MDTDNKGKVLFLHLKYFIKLSQLVVVVFIFYARDTDYQHVFLY